MVVFTLDLLNRKKIAVKFKLSALQDFIAVHVQEKILASRQNPKRVKPVARNKNFKSGKAFVILSYRMSTSQAVRWTLDGYRRPWVSSIIYHQWLGYVQSVFSNGPLLYGATVNFVFSLVLLTA